MDNFAYFSFIYIYIYTYIYIYIIFFSSVNANYMHFGSGVYFYWNFNIPPSFPLISLFYTRYKKVNQVPFVQVPFGQKYPH